MELLSCIENHVFFFPPFAPSSVSICLSLYISTPCSILLLHYNISFSVCWCEQFPTVVEHFFSLQTPGGAIHTSHQWAVSSGDVHIFMTTDRLLKNTSILSVLPSLLCRCTSFVLKGQQSWVLSPSHLHVRSVKKQGALSLGLSLYLPLTHKYTPFCT